MNRLQRHRLVVASAVASIFIQLGLIAFGVWVVIKLLTHFEVL